jgi:drug/metabolite transporter (DMT)-like permease
MFYLFATIFLNVVISAMFKLFPRFGINALQAIVTNYLVCVITGIVFVGNIPFNDTVFHAGWFPWALAMGVMFISIFNLLAYSTKVDGITTTIIANKLSLVIPVIFSVILYHEHIGIGKISGIIIALPAIYLASRVAGRSDKPQNLFWPFVLFAGSGLLDTSVKYVQYNFLSSKDLQAVFTVYCFGVAGSIGLAVVIIMLLAKKIVLSWRNIVAGVCVGVPNFFSIYFLIRMLHSNFMQSSAAIPILNIGILVASAVTAIIFFREKSNALRMIGLALSIIAILLIAYGDMPRP